MRISTLRKAFFWSVLVLGCLAMPAAGEFTISPYIQNPGTTTMTVMWTSDTLDQATVTVGREGGAAEVIAAPKPLTVTYSQRLP